MIYAVAIAAALAGVLVGLFVGSFAMLWLLDSLDRLGTPK